VDQSCDLQNPLEADARDFIERLFGQVGIEDNLDQSVAVAQIHKDDAAMIAAAMNPAGHSDGLSRVAGTQFAASVSFIHSAPPKNS